MAKLIDATIEAIGEAGYQRATVQEICGRAGLSAGAMFRQFDGRLDLVVAASQEIVERQLSAFRAMITHLDSGQSSLESSLIFLQQAQSSNLTHALREVYMAARSDTELRERITPTVENYYASIVSEIERSAVLDQFPAAMREPLFFLVLHLFSGQAVTRPVYPRPDLDDTVRNLALELLVHYAATHRREK